MQVDLSLMSSKNLHKYIRVGRPNEAHNLASSTALPHPDFNLADIKSKLGDKLGLSNTEIVALFGYRTLGFLSNKDSHKEQRWSQNPWVFDNNYYTELLKKDSIYLKTPSDLALIEDSNLLEVVTEFAKNQEVFFQQFSKVYEKISEFGNENLLEEKINHI